MSTDSVSHEDFQQKPVEIVYDEERIKILIDDTRKSILSVLAMSDNDMSVSEIADQMNTNPQRIYHHVDKLVENGFIVKTREERKKRSITTYYSRTAKAFIVSYSTDRGYIHDDALIEHFLSTFKSILNLQLNDNDEELLGDLIKELARISEQVFMQYSNRSDQNIQRHAIENLYFLLEYLIFYTHPDSREIINEITDLVLPKLLDNPNNPINTLKF